MADNAFYDERVTTATFIFEVDGQTIGQFMEVTGLQVEVSVETVEEGGQNGYVHHLPGRMTWPNITLKRGVTQTDNLFTWLNSRRASSSPRRGTGSPARPRRSR